MNNVTIAIQGMQRDFQNMQRDIRELGLGQIELRRDLRDTREDVLTLVMRANVAEFRVSATNKTVEGQR